MSIVISLYDYTGVAAIPWAEAGHTCYCYDIQHEKTRIRLFESGGSHTRPIRQPKENTINVSCFEIFKVLK